MEFQIRPGDVRRLLREILKNGIITYPDHARERMEQRHITMIDCENVLWTGKVKHPEWINNTWRYSVVTGRLEVVIEFASEIEIVIVTAMRTG